MRDIFKTVPRDWVERLFTWPWRPWQATKKVRDYRAEFEHVRHAPASLTGLVNRRQRVDPSTGD